MEVGRPASGRHSNLSQINVTPLVDVMLVLLVIFMVTAPMLDQGVEVELPEVEQAPSLPGQTEPLLLSLKKDGSLFLGQTRIDNMDKLTPVLQQALKGKKDREVFLEADKAVAYGRVIALMAAVRKAGIAHLGMVTQPLEE